MDDFVKRYKIREEFLCAEVTQEYMVIIANRILDDWRTFGRAAGLAPGEIEAILYDSHKEEHRRYDTLERWKSRHLALPNSPKATYKALLEILIRIGRLDVAKKVCKLHGGYVEASDSWYQLIMTWLRGSELGATRYGRGSKMSFLRLCIPVFLILLCLPLLFKDTNVKGIPTVDSPPNMLLLRYLPTTIDGKPGFVRILTKISTDRATVDSFGYHILKDKSKVHAIGERFDPIRVNITREILKEWLNGRGKQPVTWNTLIWALRETKLFTLVEDIKASVRLSVLDTPFEGPVYDETLFFAEQLRAEYNGTPIIKSEKLLSTIKAIGDIIPFVLPTMKSEIHLDHIIQDIQPGSRTLFTGRPGVGKSTLTRYMALKWAQGELLTHCVLTIQVPLMSTMPSLQKVLVKALPDYSPTYVAQVEREIKDNHGSRICFILDALDEYVHAERGEDDWVYSLLKGETLPKCTVIVTSRNNRGVQELVNTNTFSIQDEVIGFSTDGLELYFDKLPLALKSTISAVLDVNINVKLMCYLPLHMTMVVYLALVDGDHISAVVTETVLYTHFLALTIEQYSDRHGWTAKMTEECLRGKTKPRDLCDLLYRIGALAYNSLKHGNNSFDSSYFEPAEISVLQNVSLFGITLERDIYDDLYHYTFAHRTFQEYLAAFHISRSTDAFNESISRTCTLPADFHISRSSDAFDQSVSVARRCNAHKKLNVLNNATILKFYFGLLGNYRHENEPSKVYDIFKNYVQKYEMLECRSQYAISDTLLDIAREAGIQSTMLLLSQDTNLFTGPECNNYTFRQRISVTRDCIHLAYILSWIPVRSLRLGFFPRGIGFDEQNCVAAFSQQLEHIDQHSIQEVTVSDHMYDEYEYITKWYVCCRMWVQFLLPLQTPNLRYFRLQRDNVDADCFENLDSDLTRKMLHWLSSQHQLNTLEIHSRVTNEVFLNGLSNVFAKLGKLRKLQIFLNPTLSDSIVNQYSECLENLENLEELSIGFGSKGTMNESVSTEAMLKLNNSVVRLDRLKTLLVDCKAYFPYHKLCLRIIAGVLQTLPNLEHLTFARHGFVNGSKSAFILEKGFSAAKKLSVVKFVDCFFLKTEQEAVFESLKQAKKLEALYVHSTLHLYMLKSVPSFTRSIAELNQLQHLKLEYPVYEGKGFATAFSKSLSTLPNLVSLNVSREPGLYRVIATFSPVKAV